MYSTVLISLTILALGSAQIPNLGFCPDYVPMANFEMGKFLGVWYEAERYFQLSEVVSRCVMTNYSLGPDNKLRVSNEVTNRFTGIKRVIEGEVRTAVSKAEEGKLHVKYTTIPLTPETKYSVLETDYKSYAVMWSCSGIGPVHAQSAWIMTRERLPPGEVLQRAYAVLDKYKISKTFFVKTDQADCAYTPLPITAEKPQSDNSEYVEENTEGRAVDPHLKAAEEPVAPAGHLGGVKEPAILASEGSEPVKYEKESVPIPHRHLKAAGRF